MKVLITGATGRVGSALAGLLARAGHEVRAVVRPGTERAPALEGLPVEKIPGDVRDRFAMVYAASGVDAVYHLAAVIRTPDRRAFVETNILGTQNVLEACAQQGGRIQRLVFASTDALYDKSGFRHKPIDENEPIRAGDAYTMSKYTGELLCRQALRTDHLPITVARLPLTLAPGEFLDRERLPGLYAADYRKQVEAADRRELSPPAREAVTRFLSTDLSDNPLIVARTLDGVSFKRVAGDVRDIANGLALILNEPAAAGETVNLSGWPILWEDFIPYLAERTGQRYVDLRLPITPIHYEYSREKARYLLGHCPRYDARAMIDAALGEESSTAGPTLKTGEESSAITPELPRQSRQSHQPEDPTPPPPSSRPPQ